MWSPARTPLSARPGKPAAGHDDQRPDQDHPELDAGVRLGVKLRGFIGVIFGVSGMPGGSVSMMRGSFVFIILMMLCSFGVMLGRVFVVFSGLLVVGRSLMFRHCNLHFFESLVDVPAETIDGARVAGRHRTKRTLQRTCDDGLRSAPGTQQTDPGYLRCDPWRGYPSPAS